MVKNLTMGRYIKTNSWIHNVDARLKLIGLIVFITLLMTSSNAWQYAILICYSFLMILLTKIPITTFIKGIKPLLKIIIFTAFLQFLFSGGGVIYFELGPIVISQVGIRNGFNIFIRFSLIILITSVTGLSTKPFDLTKAVEKLLKPLKKIGVHAQSFALVMSIALRFIPTLFDETHRLKKAQEARGMQFDEGNLVERMRKFLPLLVPIFTQSFFRASELAATLDVRGYISQNSRTQFHHSNFKRQDAQFIICLAVVTFIHTFF